MELASLLIPDFPNGKRRQISMALDGEGARRNTSINMKCLQPSWFRLASAVLIGYLGATICTVAFAQGLSGAPEPQPGTEDKGGYSFDYSCTKVSERSRTIRICNRPGAPRTPIFWRCPKEVFVDTTLEKCASDPCRPFVFGKGSVMPLYVDHTTLSWGLNKDEWSDDPLAYLESQKQVAQFTIFPELFVNVNGLVAGTGDNSVEIGLEMVSTARQAERGYELTYEMTNTVEGQKMEFESTDSLSPNGLRVVWDSALSEDFEKYIKQNKLHSLTPGEKTTIRIVASNIVVEPGLLKVFDGSKSIFATTAPAYVPAKK
jgi:hypothetical protein